MKLIAIVGGIGSGKSVVSHLLNLLNYEVYDCDSRAKMLMNESQIIKERLSEAFGCDVLLPDGSVNKQRLSEIIFNDKATLNKVNSIVHPVVVSDIKQCAARCGNNIYFVETALPQESGIDAMSDAVWIVEAPIEERIARVMMRNGVSRSDVLERIKNQDYSRLKNDSISRICNDGITAIMPQVTDLLRLQD